MLKMRKKNKKQEETELEVTDEMVVALANDINDVLKPDPPLDLEKPGEELQKEVEDLFDDIQEGDLLSEESWKVLKALGWGTPKLLNDQKQKLDEVKESVKTLKLEKQKEKNKISRMESIAIILKQNAVNESEVAELANAEYVKNGGISNNKASASFWGFAKSILKALDIISFENGKVILRK